MKIPFEYIRNKLNLLYYRILHSANYELTKINCE